MSDKNNSNNKEPLIGICSTPKIKKKRMKPRRLTMPSNIRTPKQNIVDEIVKRYSMQLESKPEEKLSDECLAEITTLEKSFQELDNFELQVESVKVFSDDDVENKDENNAKAFTKKETKIGKNFKKGENTPVKDSKTPIQKENKPSHRRSIRHFST